jgi:hypothetical protein
VRATCPFSGSEDGDPFPAVDPLLKRGWLIDRTRWGVYAIQLPDGLASLGYITGDIDPQRELTTCDARWQLWAGTSSAEGTSSGLR